jgi:hypothetical protein
MESPSETQVRLALQVNGHLSAAELVARTGVSQPTISRAIARLDRSILRVGRGRSTRYALRRSVAQLGDRWPLYEVGSDGEPVLLGNLDAISGGGYHLELDAPNAVLFHGEHDNGLFSGLPWFIYDMRPRGFMGRAFARSHESILHMPVNPERWTDDELMVVMLAFGADLPGSYIIGRGNIDAYLKARGAATHAIQESSRANAYQQLADAALLGEALGSSAGGEQPKFTATIANGSKVRQVIVKFSGPRSNPVGCRWADLLVAEHLAAETLAAAGGSATATAIIEAADRIFLEINRFDRVGAWGRLPVATLEALDAGLVGSGAVLWGESIPALSEQGFISGSDARWLEVVHQFGILIGNDDMHPGNLAFHLGPDLPLRPAPIYDMLPMHYRPQSSGELPSDVVRAQPARPEQMAARQRALPLAIRYWQKVAYDPRISAEFHRIAATNAL